MINGKEPGLVSIFDETQQDSGEHLRDGQSGHIPSPDTHEVSPVIRVTIIVNEKPNSVRFDYEQAQLPTIWHLRDFLQAVGSSLVNEMLDQAHQAGFQDALREVAAQNDAPKVILANANDMPNLKPHIH